MEGSTNSSDLSSEELNPLSSQKTIEIDKTNLQNFSTASAHLRLHRGTSPFPGLNNQERGDNKQKNQSVYAKTGSSEVTRENFPFQSTVIPNRKTHYKHTGHQTMNTIQNKKAVPKIPTVEYLPGGI